MKKLLLLICIVPILAYSQQIQSDTSGGFTFATISYGIDTIKCLMLVSDTAHYISYYHTWIDCAEAKCTLSDNHHSHYRKDSTDLGVVNPQQRICYWYIGYYVTNRWGIGVKYLDINKQPLKSTITVWMSVKASQ